jgi:hypothetical protein
VNACETIVVLSALTGASCGSGDAQPDESLATTGTSSAGFEAQAGPASTLDEEGSALQAAISRLQPYMRDYPPPSKFAAREPDDDASFLFAEWAREHLEDDEVLGQPTCRLPAQRGDLGRLCCVRGQLVTMAAEQLVAIRTDGYIVSGLAARGGAGRVRGESVELCGAVTGRMLEGGGATPIVSGILFTPR